MKHNINAEWRAIPGYEGLYSVSEFGEVLSYPKGRFKTTRMLRSKQSTNGYILYGLSKSGVTKTYGAHRLVAFAFIGPCPPGMVVNHLDGDTLNNHFSNLEYTTHTENVKHGSDRRFFLGQDYKKPATVTGHEIRAKRLHDIPNGFVMPSFGWLHTNSLQK